MDNLPVDRAFPIGVDVAGIITEALLAHDIHDWVRDAIETTGDTSVGRN
jgi:hypothetical protein